MWQAPLKMQLLQNRNMRLNPPTQYIHIQTHTYTQYLKIDVRVQPFKIKSRICILSYLTLIGHPLISNHVVDLWQHSVPGTCSLNGRHQSRRLLCEIHEASISVTELGIKAHQLQHSVGNRAIILNLLQIAKINLALFHLGRES